MALRRNFYENHVFPALAPSLQSPGGGLAGWLARRKRRATNGPLKARAVERMGLPPAGGVLVELGAFDGAGLAAVWDLAKDQPPEESPSRMVFVEENADNASRMEAWIQEHLPDEWRSVVEVQEQDCHGMAFLSDDSVDAMFGIEIVVFLDPLEAYTHEWFRCLKPGGTILLGTNNEDLGLKEQHDEIFVNTNPERILYCLQHAGFEDVVLEEVTIPSHDPPLSYLEFRATKPDPSRKKSTT